MDIVRKEKLLALINKNGAVSIKEICDHFSSVSSMTIHRDLAALEADGLIIRVRGGAKCINYRLESEPSFDTREYENRQSKEQIAKKAASLIHGGNSIYIDSGTTGTAFAKNLPDITLGVFTNAPNIAVEIASKHYPSVNLCGGTLNKQNLAVCGSRAKESLSGINIDIAFVSTSGFTAEGGFTCGNSDEADLKKYVVEKARTVVMMMDSSKVGRLLPYTFAMPGDIDIIVTDDTVPKRTLSLLRKSGIEICQGTEKRSV